MFTTGCRETSLSSSLLITGCSRTCFALRDETADRIGVRDALSAVLVAHAEAEEQVVYPKLRRRATIDAEEAEHGEEEHAEGHEALLKVLELKGTDTQA
jgi:iron-sulfur cluster repair protein YtfE (RIC family)